MEVAAHLIGASGNFYEAGKIAAIPEASEGFAPAAPQSRREATCLDGLYEGAREVWCMRGGVPGQICRGEEERLGNFGHKRFGQGGGALVGDLLDEHLQGARPARGLVLDAGDDGLDGKSSEGLGVSGCLKPINGGGKRRSFA
jgi:hypothetical protein